MHVKYLAEMSFWARQHEIEGKNAFISEQNLKGIHQRYKQALQIQSDTYKDLTILDMGCGPRGSLHMFQAKQKFGVDPLANAYHTIFGIGRTHKMIYLSAPCEQIPLLSSTVDVVLSVNSLDHMDNIDDVINEVYRVLKPKGEFRANVNLCDNATVTEPIPFSKASLHELLLARGFEITEVDTFPEREHVPFERVLISCKKV